jgi:hypothetical protein
MKVNAMDVWRVHFASGTKVSLMSNSREHARLMAAELFPDEDIILLHRLDLWEEAPAA